MTQRGVTEAVVEEALLAWLEGVGSQIAHNPDIAPEMPAVGRADYGEVVLARRMHDALARFNPTLPAEAIKDAFRELARPEGGALILRNRAGHRLLMDGVTVERNKAGVHEPTPCRTCATPSAPSSSPANCGSRTPSVSLGG